MTEKPAPTSRRSITSFAPDDDIPLPTPAQLAAAKTAGEGLGFRSEKPVSVVDHKRPRKIREVKYTDAIHVRSLPEDRERFEDFVWRNRLSKGEAMTLLLDYALAEEKRRAPIGK